MTEKTRHGALRDLSEQSGTMASGAASASFSPTVTLASADGEIAYISGVASDGSLATTSFWTYEKSVAHKWPPTNAGSAPAATLTYAFDPTSSFTATEMNTFRESLALWSAVANLTFTQQSGTRGADVVLTRGTTGAETSVTTTASGVGPLQALEPSATISIATSTYGFDLSGSFSTASGYGLATIIHEIGHALGLGHAGPYDAAVNTAMQQFSPFDTRLWSIMSYISPTDSNAKYYASYPVSGTQWNGATNSTTMMPLDIQAIQRLYGAPSASVLSGGQVFGFNTNVAAAIRPFFDFTQNTNPIVTLYDTGAGNTLDLSGYTSAATVDLRDGHFSSFDGMTNNLAIAFGTRIDTTIGTQGGATFYTNADSDTIVGEGSQNTVYFAGPQSSYTIIPLANGATVTSGSISDTLSDVQNLVFSDQAVALSCFAAGTPILTERGEVPVEHLRAGDRVRSTLTGRHRAICWIGHREIAFARHPQGDVARPLRICAGAFGDGVPHRDVWLSPEHAVHVDGMLVPIGCLENGGSVARDMSRDAVAYYHIQLERHDVVYAAGLPAETWRDTGNRHGFANAAVTALHPPYVPAGSPPGAGEPPCAPVVVDHVALRAVRAGLARRAEAIGLGSPAERVVTLAAPGEYGLEVAPNLRRVRLVSAAGRVGGDRRRLGALLTGLAIDGRPLDLCDARLASGFHALERHGGTPVRWTDGDAVLVLDASSSPRCLTVRVAASAAGIYEAA